MSDALTSKQKLILTTISDLTHKLGYPPTLEQVRVALGYPRVSSVQRHTDALKKKGYLADSRGISVPTVAKQVKIPLVGNVACGMPLLAVENIEAYVTYDASKIRGAASDYFFLRAVGDSMDNADINGKNIDNGDYVLVKKTNVPEFGKRVVALLGEEATIKKLQRNNGHIVLQPESTNPANKPILVFDDLLIQGNVVDVVKGR